MVTFHGKTELEIIQQAGALRAAGNQIEVATSKIFDVLGDIQRHSENLLKSGREIENITSKIAQQEEILQKICEEIKLSQDFDFVAMQLISPWEKTIETVIGSEWVDIAKHYLEPDPDLRDVQADIFYTKRTEIIAGWDDRFDKWIYERYSHQNYIRIFTPILICKNTEGQINKDWFEDYHWHYSRKSQESNVNLDWFHDPKKRNSHNKGQHTIIEAPDLPKDLEFEVIGTVEVGYDVSNYDKPIDPQQAIKLAKLVSIKALEIVQTRFSYLLNTITNSAISVVKADSASLHFLQIPMQNTLENSDSEHINFLYEVFAGRIGHHLLKSYLPRKNGLGQQAIYEQKVKLIPDPEQQHHLQELKYSNPQVFAEGIKAIAALPLIADHQQGVLYIHFRDEHQFTLDEIRWLESFNVVINNAIRHAVSHLQMRQKTRQLVALHSVTNFLACISDRNELLYHLAAIILNILGADIVNIYEYDQSRDKFLTSPTRAGRLKNEIKPSEDVQEHEVPYKLIRYGKSVYIPHLNVNNPQSQEEELFRDSNFSIREDVKSVVGLLLKQKTADDESLVYSPLPEHIVVDKVRTALGAVRPSVKQGEPRRIEDIRRDINQEKDREIIFGVIFIGYRRHYEFSSQEIQFLHILATSAAITMKKLKFNDKHYLSR